MPSRPRRRARRDREADHRQGGRERQDHRGAGRPLRRCSASRSSARRPRPRRAAAAGPRSRPPPQSRTSDALRQTSAAPPPCLRGRAGEDRQRMHEKAFARRSLVFARRPAIPPPQPPRAAQVRRQAVQGHARRDGRRGFPGRLREEGQARDEALRRRAAEEKAARKQGSPARPRASGAGAEALRAQEARTKASLAKPEDYKEAARAVQAEQEEDPEGFAEEYGEGDGRRASR